MQNMKKKRHKSKLRNRTPKEGGEQILKNKNKRYTSCIGSKCVYQVQYCIPMQKKRFARRMRCEENGHCEQLKEGLQCSSLVAVRRQLAFSFALDNCHLHEASKLALSYPTEPKMSEY